MILSILLCGLRLPINCNAQISGGGEHFGWNRFHLVLTFDIYIHPNRVMEHYWLQAHMMVLQEYGQKMVSQTRINGPTQLTAIKNKLPNS